MALTTTYRGYRVREPSSRSIHDDEAEEPEILCADCGDETVSSEGDVCADCLPQHRCATCLGRIDPGDVWCSTQCRNEDLHGERADLALDREQEVTP